MVRWINGEWLSGEQTIFYEGIAVGKRRVDFFVDRKILVELKAVIELENVHLAQAINYIEAFNLEVGLLINFGATSLQLNAYRVIKIQINHRQSTDLKNQCSGIGISFISLTSSIKSALLRPLNFP